MKKIFKTHTKQLILSLCSLMLLVAPMIASSQASPYHWGETKIPNSLKN